MAISATLSMQVSFFVHVYVRVYANIDDALLSDGIRYPFPPGHQGLHASVRLPTSQRREEQQGRDRRPTAKLDLHHSRRQDNQARC
eukprot:scaffold6046_cov42-Prasinocladus_malaysianus.AAC.1